MDEMESKIIGALVKKLGGEVELTPDEMENAPVVTLQRTVETPNIKLWVEKPKAE